VPRSLTLLDGGVIDDRSIDRILQAIVFFADSVAVRSTYEVPRPYREREIEIQKRLDSLREQGFLKLWAHEYEVDDTGYARGRGLVTGSRRPADLVVSEKELRASLNEMDAVLRSVREEAYRDGSDSRHPFRQGTAEVVGLRNQLSSLVISSELKQDGLIANPALRRTLIDAARPVAESSFQLAVVRDVVSRLRIGSLTQLTADQLVECRRYSAGFRELLEESLLSVAGGMHPVLTPEAIAQELISKYRAITSEYSIPKLAQEMGDELLWDVAGATIPATIVLKYGFKAFQWRRAAMEVRPYLLLMHLERALTPSRRGGLR
jgi:hypothetical protein